MMANDEKAEGTRASPGLAALLFTEACGFVELFDADERRALDLLGAYRSCAEPIIAEHGGELVDATGSELLAAFSSAVAAAQCAMHLGLALRLELRRAPELGIRAGLHVGEIWRDEKRAYGNGVNVAARVMQAAPPGAAYLSEDIFRQIETKLDLRIRPVPPLPMKNIARSLLLYEVDWGAGFVEAAPPSARDRVAGDESDAADALDASDGLDAPVAAYASGGDGSAEAGPAARRDASSSEERIRRASERLSRAVEARVAQALARHADIVVERGRRGLKARLTIDTDRPSELSIGGGDAPPPAEAPPAPRAPSRGAETGDGADEGTGAPSRRPASSLEARRERASAQLSGAVKSLVLHAGLGAAFGYGFYLNDKPLYLAGAALLGLLPFLSALRKALRVGSEIKAIEREEGGAGET